MIKPYITGKELVSIPSLVPKRFCIDFGDSTRAEAESHHELVEFLVTRIHSQSSDPEKTLGTTRWWRHRRSARKLYDKVAESGVGSVVMKAQTGKVWAFANPEETAADIARLRELHVEMDQAVAAAYGWEDLDLEHGFHETPQGVRFTISEAARWDVLDRLLALNHERYEEEVRQGLHEKKKKTSRKRSARKKKANDGQLTMF